MKDVFAARARRAFQESMEIIIEELQKQGNHDEELAAALLTDAGVEAWLAELRHDLKKVKYGKAVQSLTGSPATVFHALCYHDAAAAEASSPVLSKLGFARCSEAQEDAALWWETVVDSCHSAFRAAKADVPSVPSKQAIADDIQSRKTGSKHGKPAVLLQGADEILRQLHTRREATPPDDALERFKKLVMDGGWQADKSAGAEQALLKALPSLGDSVSGDDWNLLQQATTFVSIDAHVPKGMMSGIEHVAQDLAGDGSMETLASAALDPKFMSKIGERVLGGVSSDDVSQFASNIDKLLPIITNAAKPV